MKLHRQGRKFYTLGIRTEPEITSCQASFDDGVTWATGEHVGQQTVKGDAFSVFRWLLAGPDSGGGDGLAVLAANTSPLLRVNNNPEVEIVTSPHRVYLFP